MNNGSKALIIGTFDFLHEGHTNLINEARDKFGEENLVIAVASDE